jgi:two-component sensor histidine kinase
MAQGTDPDTLAAIEAEFKNANRTAPLIRYRRKDGSAFWATILVQPVRDAGGEIVQYFSSFMDVTQLKQEEYRLRFLLDELNHRKQNTLANVLGIAAQTLHGVVDQE